MKHIVETDPKKSLWEILVPRFSNAGVEFPPEYHKKWDAHAEKISGGITILRPAKGRWTNPDGKLFDEEVIPVRLYATEAEIDKIIDFTLEHYDQEAVLAYEVSGNVKLKYR